MTGRGRNDKPREARNFFIRKRTPGGSGPLNYSLYTAALHQVNQMQRYDITTGDRIETPPQVT